MEKIISGCATDRGRVRVKNQDRIVCHTAKTARGILAVACVCDGIGSFFYSEIAAQMVTEGVSLWFGSVLDNRLQALSEENLVEDFDATLRELNQLVCERRKRERMDLGCTMSALLVISRNYYIFHVGDSRIYLVHQNRRKQDSGAFDSVGEKVSQITRDEVAMSEANGIIKPRLANYMGKGETLWVNRLNGVLSGGEAFVLGSDGLFRRLEEWEIYEKIGGLSTEKQTQKLCQELIRIVEDRGERDNVSCGIVKIKK